MVPVHALWLPIVLAAVIVFVVSSIIHMVLPTHKSDYRKLPDEDRVADALRTAGVTPGRVYFLPFTTHKEMKKPEVAEKFKRGPVALLTIMPNGCPQIGKFLAQWFIYCLVVGCFTAYLTGRTRPPGAHYLSVFRVAGTAAFMGYALAQIQDSIWKGQTWGVTSKHVLDGFIYGLLTAGTFGWLWPR
jgi:hypothetical protein